MKFHKREIRKGKLGELSKIQEELDEAFDAEEQGVNLMLLIELADIVGAVALVAEKHGMDLDELVKFAKLRRSVGEQEDKERADKQSRTRNVFTISGLPKSTLLEKEAENQQFTGFGIPQDVVIDSVSDRIVPRYSDDAPLEVPSENPDAPWSKE